MPAKAPPRSRAAAARFRPAMFTFLHGLEAHNNRAWFEAHRQSYERDVKAPMLAFIAGVQPGLRKLSPQIVADPKPVGGSMFRIHRDTRFSKDKAPYKTRAAARFWHAGAGRSTEATGPGFYLSIGHDGAYAGAGMWHPEPAALGKVRRAIAHNSAGWQRVLDAKLDMEDGERLQRPPRGFDTAHPFVEDLKRRDFVAWVAFTPKQVTAPDFPTAYLDACKRMAPLDRFLARALNLDW